MAIIVPFGDPNAHGTFADALTFRRTRGGVVLEKKPRPRKSNTVAQLAQRVLFTTAQQAWYQYDPLSKPYINTRSTQLGLTGRQLFSRAKLLNQLPVGGNWVFDEIPSLQLITPAGITSATHSFVIEGWCATHQIYETLGSLNVDTNIWTPRAPHGFTAVVLHVLVVCSVQLPFRFGIAFITRNQQQVDTSHILRLPPQIIDPPTQAEHVISEDDSTWSSDQYTSWLATNKF